jgi:4-hydroxy-tetrahydrodipicolinate reductase
MKLVLIGYGRMGHEIEQAALEAGHTVTLKIDKENTDDLTREATASADVAIEFTGPETAPDLIIKALSVGLPVVSGSTGWMGRLDEVTAYCRKIDGAFLYSSNFSLGVNLLFHLNEELARIMCKHSEYKVTIEEVHHIHKLDAPSGTAVTLADEIIRQHPGYNAWDSVSKGSEVPEKHIPVESVREGSVAGIHSVTWDSVIDTISLRHEAVSRKGFAVGALMAASFLAGKKGIFSMKDVLEF